MQIQKGIISEYFQPMRGRRQWDPIFPYLFILCVEILGILFQNNKDIKHINIDGEEYDDTSLFTDGSQKSLDEIL